MQKISREKFIRLLSLTAGGIIVGSCQETPSKHENSFPKKEIIKATKLLDKDVVLITSDHKDYDQLRKGFNKRIEKKPKCIALCLTEEGVRQSIQHANQNKLKIAVKSGGHCLEGFSVNNSMVVNVSLMDSAKWLDTETVSVGPAATVENLYKELLPKQKIIPSGSCAGVAIGGLTLGGGYGIFSRQYGLTCDSLEKFTLIDGEGNIHKSEFDKELSWACKGGGNGNFGVVTEMIFKVKQAPPKIQSHVFLVQKSTIERTLSILEKWFSITENLDDRLFCGFVLNGKSITIFLVNSDPLNCDSSIVISEIANLSDKTISGKIKPTIDAVKSFYGIKHPLYFKNSCAGLYKSFKDIDNVLKAVVEKIADNSGLIYAINTWGGQINNSQMEQESAFPHRAYLYASELQTYWENPAQEKRQIEKFREVINLFINNGSNKQYRNYPNVDFVNWEEAYYGLNYKRLQLVKRKYDENNIFSYEQSVRN